MEREREKESIRVLVNNTGTWCDENQSVHVLHDHLCTERKEELAYNGPETIKNLRELRERVQTKQLQLKYTDRRIHQNTSTKPTCLCLCDLSTYRSHQSI